jgi:DNA ligase (NAD+)
MELQKQESVPQVFEGKTFVFTGTLSSMTRQKAGEIVRKAGGNVSSSVGPSVNYLVEGASAGSKHEKAVALGITILTESQFLEMSGQGDLIPENVSEEPEQLSLF